MPVNNERAARRAIINAFGGTGKVNTEKDFDASLVAAVQASVVKTKPAVVALVALTDSTAGTPDNTVAAIPAATAATTDTSAASLTSTNASLTAIRNDLSDLTAKVNAIIAALKA